MKNSTWKIWYWFKFYSAFTKWHILSCNTIFQLTSKSNQQLVMTRKSYFLYHYVIRQKNRKKYQLWYRSQLYRNLSSNLLPFHVIPMVVIPSFFCPTLYFLPNLFQGHCRRGIDSLHRQRQNEKKERKHFR